MGSSSEPLGYLLAAGATLLLAAIASSTSAALAALGEHRAEALLDDKERKPAAGLRRLVERPDAVRLSMLALDSLSKVAFGVSLSIFALNWRPEGWIPAAVIAGGALLLLLVQSVLRSLAVRDPVGSLGWTAPMGAATEALLRPLVAPLLVLSRLIRGDSGSSDDTTEQLEYLIEKGAEAGFLDDDKRDLLESVIEFSHVRVREIMVPRPKIVALQVDAPYDEVVRVVVESGHSRLPVYEDSVDNIVGVLYARRLLEGLNGGGGAKNFRLRSHLASPFFVPETMKISHLLAEFQHRSLQIAVVVDEFGGTAGLVTLEDVVEEIVGEIRDEDDDDEQPIRLLSDGLFLAEGGVSVRDAEEFLDEALPEDVEFEFPEDGDYDTVGGFVTAMAGRVPEVGEEVRFGGLVFTVRAADEKRVLEIELSVDSALAGVTELPPPEEELDEPEERMPESAAGGARRP